MADLLQEAFSLKHLQGLGRVLVCRICGAIFVSAIDAQRHLNLYHRIFSSYRLKKVLEEVER